MLNKDISKHNNEIDHFDTLKPIKSSVRNVADGIIYKQLPYFFSDAYGKHFVNIYSLEVDSEETKAHFAMEFSRDGDYCINLVKKAEKKVKGKIVGALNCNFGLIVDKYDRFPVDISYNLHIENKKLIQIPSVDKPAILIDPKQKVSMKYLFAIGKISVGKLTIEWVGAKSKKYNYFYARNRGVIYNSYCRGLLLLKNEVTGTKKYFDKERSFTPKDRRKIDIIVGEKGNKLKVISMNRNTKTHLFEGNFILSLPKRYTNDIKLGDTVQIESIGEINPAKFVYGSTGSPLLVPNVKEARKNILADRGIQTRSEGGKGAYRKDGKFCRSCIIKSSGKTIFFLADARKGMKGQEGLSIYMLRYILAHLYPNFDSAVNVDGGNAPKLIVDRDGDYDVLGNLQYKKWPTESNPKFTWDGFRGRKVPAIIYTYI